MIFLWALGESYDLWANNTYFDEDTRNELLSIKNNEKRLKTVFIKTLNSEQVECVAL